MENNDKIMQIIDSVRPDFEILGTFAFSGDGDLVEVNKAFEKAFEAAKAIKEHLKEELGNIPEDMEISGCQATGESHIKTDWSDIDEFLSYPPAFRFTTPQKYGEFTMKLNSFLIAVQQQFNRAENVEDDIPSNVSFLKVQVIQEYAGCLKTLGFTSYATVTENEADIIKSIEREKGRPIFNYDLWKNHKDLDQEISLQVLGGKEDREEQESAGMYLAYTFFSDNYALGEQIRLDFEGMDGSSSSEGNVIFVDSEHVIVQFHFAGPVGASGFNRSGIPYEDVLKITGVDFPHSEFDRFIDILNESTLEHTLGAEEY